MQHALRGGPGARREARQLSVAPALAQSTLEIGREKGLDHAANAGFRERTELFKNALQQSGVGLEPGFRREFKAASFARALGEQVDAEVVEIDFFVGRERVMQHGEHGVVGVRLRKDGESTFQATDISSAALHAELLR